MMWGVAAEMFHEEKLELRNIKIVAAARTYHFYLGSVTL